MEQTMSSTTATKEELATKALELQKQIDSLSEDLNAAKDELRDIANGNKTEIKVSGLGKVNISAPRSGSERVVLTLDTAKLEKVPELRAKLIERGIAKEEVKVTPAAKASVTIKPNV